MDETKPNSETRKGKRKSTKEQRLTDKQQAYAQKLASGMHVVDAFRAVYNCKNMNTNTSYKMANRVKQNPLVVTRVEELREQAKLATAGKGPMSEEVKAIIKYQAPVVADVVINQRFLVEALLQDRDLARHLGQASAAVAAIKEIGKVTGLVSDNREAKQMSELDRMGVEELKTFITSQVNELQKIGLFDGDFSIIDMKPTKALN